MLIRRTHARTTRISQVYHRIFLGMAIISFAFGLLAASCGIIFMLCQPERYAAGGVIAAVSFLGFFFSRWYQSAFEPLLGRTTQTERAGDILKHQEFLRDPDVRRLIVQFLLGPVIQVAHPNIQNRPLEDGESEGSRTLTNKKEAKIQELITDYSLIRNDNNVIEKRSSP